MGGCTLTPILHRQERLVAALKKHGVPQVSLDEAVREARFMNKTVRYEVDLNHLPPLTAAQEAELKALSELPDSDIDYSEIAPLDEAFWQNAVQNPFYKPTKTSTTVRVDSDVLVWLKSQGKGYQTRMNAILRQAMLRALRPKT